MKCQRCDLEMDEPIVYRGFNLLVGKEISVSICGNCDAYITNAFMTHVITHEDITLHLRHVSKVLN